jgi:hypothetical protein
MNRRRVRRPVRPQWRRSVPIAYEDRLVVPDTLGTTIKLNFQEGPARLAPTDYSQRGRRCHLYRAGRRDAPQDPLTPGFWFSGPAPASYSQPRAGVGRSAMECERGRGLSALADTPNADSSLPAADAHPRVEARRLSIRRRADFGRCRTPVRSARAVCCLCVMSTMTHVSGCLAQSPIATLARPDFPARSPGRPSVSGITRSGEYS